MPNCWALVDAIQIDPHPLLDCGLFEADFDVPIEKLPAVPEFAAMLSLEFDAPLSADDNTRKAVRQLLRHGGYKPSGRGKPASEYLRKAGAEGMLGSINPAVDACNIVSLHSGLPISVVDRDRAQSPLRVGIAAAGSQYVFNASGQEIKLDGLLCLHDAAGPCANAVKDSQRTKTHDGTTGLVCVVWGTNALGGHTERAMAWYRKLLEQAGARTSPIG